MSEIDLSGKWSGFFNYPGAIPPVNFEAVLNVPGADGPEAPANRTASAG
jgi:hypothetical protein